MTTRGTPSTALEALHHELLGTLIEISTKVDDLKSDLPALKGEVEETVRAAQEAFEAMKSSSMTLVGWVKNKQELTLGELGKAHAQTMTESKRIFRGYDRFLWTLIAISTFNATLLVGALVALIVRGS